MISCVARTTVRLPARSTHPKPVPIHIRVILVVQADWKQEHRGQCEKLQQVFVPPPPGWRGAAAEAGGGGGGGGKAAAAAAVDIDDDDEIENPCPICLDNEDDATVDGKSAGMCYACGQLLLCVQHS